MSYKTAKGWLTEQERELLVNTARRKRATTPSLIVNIGVEYGASVVCLREGNKNAVILALDIDMSKKECGDIAYYIEADSGKFVRDWLAITGGKFVDVLFVDGDHTYEGIIKDLVWTWWIRVGGVVVFHDCYDWPPAPPKTIHSKCPGINKAVDLWAEANGKVFEEQDVVDSMRVFERVK